MRKIDKIVMIVTMAAIAVFIFTLARALYYSPSDEIPLPEDLAEKINVSKEDPNSFPVQVEIPLIKVNAKIIEVGITKKGNMATPSNFSDVGWYKYGPLPGEEGSAVLAGHVDNGLSLPGVFANLKDAKIGDDVFVTTKAGDRLHFVVRKIETFDYDNRDNNVFTEADGKILKLITCSGQWVQANKTHDKRLVLSAYLAQ